VLVQCLLGSSKVLLLIAGGLAITTHHSRFTA
jgi:hypothetical protein